VVVVVDRVSVAGVHRDGGVGAGDGAGNGLRAGAGLVEPKVGVRKSSVEIVTDAACVIAVGIIVADGENARAGTVEDAPQRHAIQGSHRAVAGIQRQSRQQIVGSRLVVAHGEVLRGRQHARSVLLRDLSAFNLNAAAEISPVHRVENADVFARPGRSRRRAAASDRAAGAGVKNQTLRAVDFERRSLRTVAEKNDACARVGAGNFRRGAVRRGKCNRVKTQVVGRAAQNFQILRTVGVTQAVSRHIPANHNSAGRRSATASTGKTRE